MIFKKAVAVFTVSCFLFSSVFNETLQASLNAVSSAAATGNLDARIVASSCGRITENEEFDSKQIVINVQDLHCHPEVQRNISKILSGLDEKFGLKNVYVEGGYGNIDTSWLCSVKDEAVKKRVMESLVDQGRLTGAEYYSALSNRPGLLKGLEDEAVHKANIVRLGKILEKKPYFGQKIKELEKELEFMEARYFSSRSRVFSRLMEKHRSGEIETWKYYTLLGKYARNIDENPHIANNGLTICINNYPNISAFIDSGRLGKQLDYNRVTYQLQELVRILKARVPYSVYAGILKNSGDPVNTDQFYLSLAVTAKDYKIGLENDFPDLSRFFEYTQKNRKLNPLTLIREEKNLTEEIRVGLSKDRGELEVSFLSDFFGYYKDYLQNRISADDYRYLKQSFDKFNSLWNKYSFDSKIKELSKDYGLLNEYYECNCRRNEYFIKNIALADTHNSTAGNAAEKPLFEQLKTSEIIVVITGGFHTEELKSILKDRRISYLTITPNVTSSADESGIVYAELAERQARLFGSQTLALALGSMGAKIIEISKDRILIEMNGERIEIKADGENEFPALGAIREIRKQTRVSKIIIRAVLSELRKIKETAKAFSNPLASAELIYELIKIFAIYGAGKDLFGSNGIIFGIASNRHVQETIQRYEHVTGQELDSFPELLQQVTANNALDKESLINTARTPLTAAIAEALSNPELSSKVVRLVNNDAETLPGLVEAGKTRAAKVLEAIKSRSAALKKAMHHFGAEIEGEFTQHLKIGKKTLPLTLVAKSFDDNSRLGKAWRAKAGGNFLYTQQMNAVNPTYVGVSGADRKLVSEYVRVLVSAGFFWNEMTEKNLLFIVDSGGVKVFDEGRAKQRDDPVEEVHMGDGVKVFEGEKIEPRADLVEEANIVLKKTLISMSRFEKESAEKVKYLRRLDGIGFFSGRLPVGTGAAGFASGPAVSGKSIAVCGRIDQRESQYLIEELNSRCSEAVNKLGHILIRFDNDNFNVESEVSDEPALKEITRFVQGFYTILNFSDVHVGSPYKFGGQKEAELTQLLDIAVANRSLVIINGDFIDLWQEKYGKTKKAHKTLFDKLKQARRVIYIAGNHDRAIHPDFLEGVKRELLETAKENVIVAGPEAETLQQFAVFPPNRELMRGARLLLSEGIENRVVYDDKENVFYVDRNILNVQAEPAVLKLYSLIRDSRENLNQKIQEDMNAEVVRYYYDIERGLYFEHGHVTDGAASKKSPVVPAAIWLLGWVGKHISGDIEHLIANVLYKMAGAAVENNLLGQTREISGRAIALARMMLWYIDENGIRDRTFSFFFGHTHETPAVFEGPVHAFLSHFTSSRAGYANSGAWAPRTKLDNYLPEHWQTRLDMTAEALEAEKSRNITCIEAGKDPASGDSLLITFKNVVRLLRGCADAAGNDEFVREYLTAVPGRAGPRPVPDSEEPQEVLMIGSGVMAPQAAVILPQNRAYAAYLRAKGYSEFRVGLNVGGKEFFRSFTPKFREQHYEPGNAPIWYRDTRSIGIFMIWAGSISGATLAAMFSGGLGLFVAIPAAIFIGNVLAHAVYDALFKHSPLSLNGTQAIINRKENTFPNGKRPMNLVEALDYLKSTNKDIKIVATDMDGTLTPLYEAIREENLSALKNVLDSGIIKLAIVTGSNIAEVQAQVLDIACAELTQAQLQKLEIYTRNGSGKYVYDARAGKFIGEEKTFDGDLIATISKVVQKTGGKLSVDRGEISIRGPEEPDFINRLEQALAEAGIHCRLMRDPGRDAILITPKSKADAVRELEADIFMGDNFLPDGNDTPVLGVDGCRSVRVTESSQAGTLLNCIADKNKSRTIPSKQVIAEPAPVELRPARPQYAVTINPGSQSPSDPAVNSIESQIDEGSLANIRKLNYKDFSYERLVVKVNALLAYDGPSKEMVRAKVISDIYAMSAAALIERSSYGDVVGIAGDISLLYEIVIVRGSVLESINMGKLESINEVVQVGPGAVKEFDAVSSNSVFEAKFRITLQKLYQQILGMRAGKLSHLKDLTGGDYNNIRNLVYIGENEGGNTAKAIIAFLRRNPRYLKNIMVTKKGMSIKFALSDIKYFLFDPKTVKLARDEETRKGLYFLPLDFETDHRGMETLIDKKIRQLAGDKFDVIIAISNILAEDMVSLKGAIVSGAARDETRKPYHRRQLAWVGALFGVMIWPAVCDALGSKIGLDDPLVRELEEYVSAKKARVVAHGLAVKAVKALGRSIEPDAELTKSVLDQPFLFELKGKVVIETMKGASLNLKDTNTGNAVPEEKLVWFSEDENGVLHVVLPAEFKIKYSDRIIAAATLAAIHEYLEFAGKTHEEAVQAGFGPELLNLPKDELEKTVEQNGNAILNYINQSIMPESNKTRLMIDWHYVQEQGLDEAVRQFGVTNIDQNGQVHVNIYLSDEMPQNPEEWELQNSAIDNNIWASTKNGALVLFTQGWDRDSVVKTINDLLTDSGNIRASDRALNRFRELFRECKSGLKIESLSPGLIIDLSAQERKMTYKDGLMVVSRHWFADENGVIDNNSIPAALGDMITVRNAESVTMAKLNTYFADIDPQSPRENILGKLRESIETFAKAGDGRLIIPDFVVSIAGKNAMKRIAALAKMNGISICINLASSGLEGDECTKLGFEYSRREGNTFVIFDFQGNRTVSNIISGYSTAQDFMREYQACNNPNKAFILSELRKVLQGSERDIVELVGMTERLKSMILSVYQPKIIDRDFVMGVGRSLDREKLRVPESDIDILVKAAIEDNLTVALRAQGIGCVNLYLDKIELELEDTDKKAEIPVLQKAFATAVLEKMLARAKLDSAGKTMGLASQELEVILGQKLLQQKTARCEAKGVIITPEMFMRQNNVNAAEFYGRLNLKIKELDGSSEPQAVNTVIELIPQLGESKIIRQQKKKEIVFDQNSIKEMLDAG